MRVAVPCGMPNARWNEKRYAKEVEGVWKKVGISEMDEGLEGATKH